MFPRSPAFLSTLVRIASTRLGYHCPFGSVYECVVQQCVQGVVTFLFQHTVERALSHLSGRRVRPSPYRDAPKTDVPSGPPASAPAPFLTTAPVRVFQLTTTNPPPAASRARTFPRHAFDLLLPSSLVVGVLPRTLLSPSFFFLFP